MAVEKEDKSVFPIYSSVAESRNINIKTENSILRYIGKKKVNILDYLTFEISCNAKLIEDCALWGRKNSRTKTTFGY